MTSSGKLYLIPCTLGGLPAESLPEHNAALISNISVFAVEDARSARRFLRSIGYTKNFDTEVKMYEIDKHLPQQDFSGFFELIQQGADAGIISEAGNPCIADPGWKIVAEAHRLELHVIPLVGPSAIFLALAASGLNGQQFCFHGYLPRKQDMLISKIKLLEKEARSKQITQIFMETPYRNEQLFEALKKTLQPDTLLCIAADITCSSSFIHTRTIRKWIQTSCDLRKKNAIFLLGY
ncbi:MAG: SAM-dependent methyltransferase [Chitinophagales bacterium]|nr:SAM-dependent methyltransferase [Chitinophagales bacterium]MDW8274552.1 SAM-dependent methyltransferase [Chitinophagales bacterium]